MYKSKITLTQFGGGFLVKGVSKSVIEISETGNRYFSKVILYISPEFSSASEQKLKKEASRLIEEFELTGRFVPLRKSIRKRKILSLLILGSSVLFSLGLLAFFLFIL